MSGLQLYGVTPVDPADGEIPAPGTTAVTYRDLGAIVREVPYARLRMEESDVADYRAVIEAVFPARPIVPAPLGVIFRNRVAVERWLELHYVSLLEGIGYIEGRALARLWVGVRAQSTGSPSAEVEDGAPADLVRSVRRHAVATVPCNGDGDAVASSFLVEQDLWDTFVAAVAQERARHPGLDVHLSGPWPPYDFVRMQFGG